MATDQKFSRIKGLSEIRRLPRLGKIRLGIKKLAKSGKEYPAEVDYFVVPPEVAHVYGAQPKELDVMFPTEDEHMVFPQAYKWYVANGLRCKGNGETAMRRRENLSEGQRVPLTNGDTSTDPNALVEVACPCPLLESGQCSQAANLMVFLPKVSLGGVYQIDTGSFHNIVRINSSIDLVRSVAGHLSLVPLKLIRQPEELQYEGKKATHYLLQLILNANLQEIALMRENSRMVISRAERLVLPAPVEDGPEPTSATPVIEDAPEPQPTANGGRPGIDRPSDICLQWVEAIERSSTLQELEAVWKRLVHPTTGVYKRLSRADQSQLTISKNQQKQILAEREDELTFG